MNLKIYTARYSDDGMMTLESKNGWYLCAARVRGNYVDQSYLYYTKKEVFKKFRALIKEKRESNLY